MKLFGVSFLGLEEGILNLIEEMELIYLGKKSEKKIKKKQGEGQCR